MTADTSNTNNEALFEQIFKDEEDHNIVLSIREELMARVMDECYEVYLKRQTVRFVVQCAHDALVKFLSFNFYYHPPIPDLTQSVWIADRPIEPSPKDTWSCDAVPIRPVSFEREGGEDISYEQDSLTSASKTVSMIKEVSNIGEVKCCNCIEHICTCVGAVTGSMMSKKLEAVYDKAGGSKVKFGSKPIGSKQSFSTKSGHDSETSDRLSESGRAVIMSPTSGNASERSLRQDSDKIKTLKKKLKPELQASKSDIEDSISSASEMKVIELSPLPPLRVYSHFHAKAVEKPKKR